MIHQRYLRLGIMWTEWMGIILPELNKSSLNLFMHAGGDNEMRQWH